MLAHLRPYLGHLYIITTSIGAPRNQPLIALLVIISAFCSILVAVIDRGPRGFVIVATTSLVTALSLLHGLLLVCGTHWHGGRTLELRQESFQIIQNLVFLLLSYG